MLFFVFVYFHVAYLAFGVQTTRCGVIEFCLSFALVAIGILSFELANKPDIRRRYSHSVSRRKKAISVRGVFTTN